MGTLRIQLFGSFRMSWDSAVEEIRVIPNVQTLLAFLLAQPGRTFSRDRILGLLWGERTEEQAHACLNTALWRLRRVLEPREIPRGTYLLSKSNGEIGFNWKSDHWLDIYAFEQSTKAIAVGPNKSLSQESASLIKEILSLYRGDFMENCQNDWVLAERERFRSLYIRCLVCLMAYSRIHGEYEQSIVYGERILEIDPLREEIHRELMQIYAQIGQRPRAVQQYEICRTRLMAELGIVPMPETRQLHSEIVKDEPILSKTPNYPTQPDQTLPLQTQAYVPAEDTTTNPIDLELVFKHTTSAMNKLEETRRDIQNIYYLLQRLQRRL